MSRHQSKLAYRAQMEHLERRQLLSAAVTAANGLRAEYFNASNLSERAFTRIDPTVDFNWAGGAPSAEIEPDTFSVRWTGQIEAQHDETYTFYAIHEDGTRVWIDGKLLIDNWGENPATVNSASIALSKGLHDIKVTYFDLAGTAQVRLQWSSPSQAREIVPQAALFSAPEPGPEVVKQAPAEDWYEPAPSPSPAPAPTEPGDGLLGEYFNATNFNERVFGRTDATIDFDWGGASPSDQMQRDTFSVRWTGSIAAPTSESYSFGTTSDDGVRLWIDGKLVIDNWTQHSPTVDFGAIDLTAGQHTIKMEYFQEVGSDMAILHWSTPTRDWEIIPQQYLYSGVNAPTPEPTQTPTEPASTPTPWPTTPSAGMIVVGPSESVKSIGQAINIAQPGQTIFILNGTYREAVTINKSGHAGRPIILQAQSIGGVTIDAGGKGFGIDGTRASFITLKGIKIVNANSGLQAQAALRVGANWMVEDVEVQRAAVCGIYVGGANSTFIRTYARDCGQQGWWVNANNAMLKDSGATGNNTRKYNPAWEAGGVKFYITSGGVVDGGVWANNGGPAIWFDYQNKNFVVKNTEVYGNHGWHQGWAGVGIASEINAGPGTIENNYVHDNSGDGIAIWEAYGNTIRNNKLVRDTIGFRDLTNRAPYRTRNNQILNNVFFQGQVNNPPGNAGNVVQGNTQGSNSGPPAGW